MPNGMIVIDKPAGWTSQDVVAKLRGLIGERRVGHGGTLDPMATGVLPVFFGRATRAVEFFEHAEKEYVAGLRLGLTTDTQDITGNVLTETSVSVTRAEVQAALTSLEGVQKQIPPMYSSIKVGGKKLYELAREGKEIPRQARRITIFETELLEGAGTDWKFRVHCSKGTYVRTLCEELGKRLGCGGCMSSLRRTRAGAFSQAIPLQTVMEMTKEERQTLLMPVDRLFSAYPALTLTENQTKVLFHGGFFTLRRPECGDGRYRFYAPDGSFLALGQVDDGIAKSVKSFFEVP